LEYIHSLISGIVLFKLRGFYIYVKPFSAEDKTFADFFSNEQYDDALLDGIWTQKDAEMHLISTGYWSQVDEDRIKEIEQNLDNMKVDYFNNFYNSTTKEYIKRNIESQNKQYSDLHTKKHVFYDKTCDYIKQYSYTSYLLQKNAYIMDAGLASKKFNINTIYNKYSSVVYDMNSKIRSIAKSDEWKSRWFAAKNSVFDNPTSSFTDLQYSIISWSNYYDNILQSMEKPSDEIIEDDIALDGWSIIQRRKRKEEDKKANAEKMLPDKMKGAGEIFIPARNSKEASDVMSLNDREALSRIKSLRKDLAEHGAVQESDLTSTRRDLQMQGLQMSKERRR
jgi:hypothetical protein